MCVSCIRHLWEQLVAQSATVVWGDVCTGAGTDLLHWAAGALLLSQPPHITGTVGEPAGRSADRCRTNAASEPQVLQNSVDVRKYTTRISSILRLAFMNFHWSLLLVGRWVGHWERTTLSPSTSKHRVPLDPHRTSPSEFRSQCCSGSITCHMTLSYQRF